MNKLKQLLPKKLITNSFHKLYYYSRKTTWNSTSWLGLPISKCPLDLWTYQEIIFEVQPDVIIETGTGSGGSTLFFASLCELTNKGKVISIELGDMSDKPQHKRITYLLGSSTSKEILQQVQQLISDDKKVLVNLDSEHTKKHVLEELKLYSKLVTVGSYIIVEDTNIGGHPVKPDYYPGPMEAVKEFLKTNSDFIIDKNREKFYLTFNPNGYLKRVK